MRVLIVGLPYFTENLVRDLRAFDSDNTYYRLDTYYNKKDRLKALLLIPRVDVVYSINGALDKSRVFDWAFFWKKKVMMTWVGTDVTKAKKLEAPNTTYLNKSHHYCEVNWIQEELKSLNINAKILNFFNFSELKPAQMPNDKKLKVLTYISKDREAYYGWSQVIEAARACPMIEFTVVGTEGINEWPENVQCKGWVDNMPELFEKHHATIRFVEHDGLSGFVLESLLRGKHVLYSQPLNHCVHVNNTESMINALKELSDVNESGKLSVNESGASFVADNFNREKIFSDLIAEMKS
jgi:hypothetical protein